MQRRAGVAGLGAGGFAAAPAGTPLDGFGVRYFMFRSHDDARLVDRARETGATAGTVDCSRKRPLFRCRTATRRLDLDAGEDRDAMADHVWRHDDGPPADQVGRSDAQTGEESPRVVENQSPVLERHERPDPRLADVLSEQPDIWPRAEIAQDVVLDVALGHGGLAPTQKPHATS